MSIELVVFDMAGTTVVDGNAVASNLQAALAKVGVRILDTEVKRVMGLPMPEAIQRLVAAKRNCPPPLGKGGLGGSAVQQDLDLAGIHADFVQRMLTYYRSDPAVREVAGTSPVFRRLHEAGIKVALDSGFSRDIADVIIERLGWTRAGLVDASVMSDEVPRGRPFPDMIWHLMKECGVTDAARVVKVGDTPVDLLEGTSAGCGRVVGVTSGQHTRAQLEETPHTDLIDSVADLPALLGLG